MVMVLGELADLAALKEEEIVGKSRPHFSSNIVLPPSLSSSIDRTSKSSRRQTDASS